MSLPLCRSLNSAALRLFWHLFIVPFKCKCLGSITINETVVFTDCIQRLLELPLLHLHNLHLLQAQEYSFCCFSVASEGHKNPPPAAKERQWGWSLKPFLEAAPLWCLLKGGGGEEAGTVQTLKDTTMMCYASSQNDPALWYQPRHLRYLTIITNKDAEP